jgi:methylated-DNA-protein-cysteine methyltransferase-like protein
VKNSLDHANWNHAVHQLVAMIPHGRLTTYGTIAAALGKPRHARQVGQALAHTPEDTAIPWHRVVNAAGKSSFPPFTQAWHVQQAALAAEGIQAFADGRFDLKALAWHPSEPLANPQE